MGKAEDEKRVRQIQQAAAFASGFIPALVKMRKAELKGVGVRLRKAELKGVGVRLTKEEVKGTMDAFRLLKDHNG